MQMAGYAAAAPDAQPLHSVPMVSEYSHEHIPQPEYKVRLCLCVLG